jgi:hypothetical protein
MWTGVFPQVELTRLELVTPACKSRSICRLMPPEEAFGRFLRRISCLMPLGQADAWLTFWLTRTPLFEYRASPAVALAPRLAEGAQVANQGAATCRDGSTIRRARGRRRGFSSVPAKDGPDYN